MFELRSKNATGEPSHMRLKQLVPPIMAAAALSAGCGDTEGTGGKEGPLVPKGAVGGKLTIAQWPLYIDPGKHGTLAEFERDTGVDAKWVEEINDNVEFFGKLRPELERGESGGRD